MNLYLIRHGEAEPTSEDKPHEERELTKEGIQVVKASAELWKYFISNFEIILSSPLKRAMQTANIIRDVLNVKPKVMEDISLLNGGMTEDLLTLADSLGMEDIAMIGHQPDLGIHISRMTGTAEINIKIPSAAIAKIFFKDKLMIGKGILELLIPPINKKG